MLKLPSRTQALFNEGGQGRYIQALNFSKKQTNKPKKHLPYEGGGTVDTEGEKNLSDKHHGVKVVEVLKGCSK